MAGPPISGARKRMLSLLVTVGAAYAALLAMVWLFEHRLVFHPDFPSRLEGDWQPAGLPVEDVWLKTGDGTKLHAWWIPAVNADCAVIYFHGNASNLANRADIFRFLHELGVSVLGMEYRGYGKSEGTPSEESFYRDAESAHDYLTKERGIPAERIVSYGASLGTAVAADLATRRRVAGVILEAPFASARAVARHIFPFLPGAGRLLRSRFDVSEKLLAARVPLLLLHCEKDPVIPFALGEEVFAAAPEPKSFLRLRGRCHEGAPLEAPGEVRERVQQFLRRAVPRNETTPGGRSATAK